MLSALEMAVLASYCECWALTKKCNHTISAEGVMVGEKVHPAVRARDAAMTQLRNYAREPGLSPVARVRLPEGKANKETDEDFLFIEAGRS